MIIDEWEKALAAHVEHLDLVQKQTEASEDKANEKMISRHEKNHPVSIL